MIFVYDKQGVSAWDTIFYSDNDSYSNVWFTDNANGSNGNSSMISVGGWKYFNTGTSGGLQITVIKPTHRVGWCTIMGRSYSQPVAWMNLRPNISNGASFKAANPVYLGSTLQ